MPTPPNHLAEIYKAIDKQFSGSKLVKIQPSDKESPDSYIITFHFTGKSRSASGEISTTNLHKIEISIPFGFPKFPPKCKPLTPIFHPDFASESISIEEYWETNNSLPDLICHIAEMINGQHYSTNEAAFNRDAASWYAKHASAFPLSTLDWKKNCVIETKGNQKDATGEALLLDDDFELELGLDDGELHIADDLGFNREDQLNLQLETTGEDDVDSSVFFPFGNEDDNQDHERRLNDFAAVRDRREFMRLKRELEGDVEFRDLYAETVRVLQNADRLYSNAKSKEKRGDTEKALELYKQVYAEVVDYPSILDDITRIEQPDPLAPDYAKEKRKHAATQQEESGAEEILRPKQQRGGAPPLNAAIRKLLLVATSLLFSGFIGIFGWKFIAKSQIAEADIFLKGCQDAVTAAAYKDAEPLCLESRSVAEDVSFFYRTDKRRILREVKKILLSAEMKDGLADKVLIDGKEYKAEEAKIVFRIKKLLEQGDIAHKEKRYGQATKNFTSVLKLTQKVKFLDEETQYGVDIKYRTCMIRQNFLIIESRRKRKKWESMFPAIKDAEKRIQKLPKKMQQPLIKESTGYRTVAQIGILGKTMDDNLRDARWEDVTRNYQKAREIAQRYYLDGQSGIEIYKEELGELKIKVLNASLYKAIDDANTAFMSGRWDDSIDAYSKAIELINDPDYALLGSEQVREHNALFKKLVLKASIVKEEEAVRTQLSNAQLKQAHKTYLKLLNLVRESSFASDPEFDDVRRDVQKKIHNIDHQLFLNGKREYLRKNYKQFFLRVYEEAESSKLRSPKVRLIEETDSALFFHLTCIEKKAGSRSTRLLLKYRYDKEAKNWSIYTKP